MHWFHSWNYLQPADVYCKNCPANAKCTTNTTLETLQVNAGFWRDSSLSSSLYPCASSEIYRGVSLNILQDYNNLPKYCIPNHTGSLCKVRTNKDEYFSYSDNTCVTCPSFWRITLVIGIITGITTLMVWIMFLEKDFQVMIRFLRRRL